MTQKTDWKKKQLARAIENFSDMSEDQQMEFMDAVKYNFALQAAKQVGMTKTVTFGDMYEIAKERQKYFNKFEGFGCGLPYFDQATMGFRGGELIIIAAPSNYGKTMLAMNIVSNICAGALKKVAFITMEMTSGEVSTRLYNMIDVQNHDSIKDTFIIQNELDVNTEHIREIIKRDKPEMVVIDYLNLLARQEPGNDERMQIDAAVAKTKRLAMDFNIPIILISQLSKTRSGADGEATIQDLKGSSAIEQASDIVFIINKPKTQMYKDEGIIEVVANLEKHRTKSPQLYHQKVILQMKGVRTNGEYSLYGA